MLSGYSVKAFVEEDDDLKYIVAIEESSNNLYVMTLPSADEDR